MEYAILYFKMNTIDFCLEKMTEIHDTKMYPKKRPATITGKDIDEGARQITCYGDFFFLEVGSFFDCLARYFTENENMHKKIYFENWIRYQRKHKPNDNLIIYLNKQFENWFDDLRKIRIEIAHKNHVSAEIVEIINIEHKNKKTNIKFLTIDINGKELELLKYCTEIHEKIDDIYNFIKENNYWDNRYPFESGEKVN